MKIRRTALIAALVLLSVCIVSAVWKLVQDRTPDTIAVTLPEASAQPETTPAASGTADTARTVSVSASTVQAVLETMTRAESYSRTLTVTNYYGDGLSVERTVEVYAKPSACRIDVTGPHEKRSILLSGEEVWIWYDDDAAHFWHGSTQSSDYDAWQSVITYEDILTLPRAAVSDASYTEYGGTQCIYAEYSTGGTNRTCIYVSCDTGLLMGSEIYDGSTLTCTMCAGATELTTPNDEYFTLPDSGELS